MKSKNRDRDQYDSFSLVGKLLYPFTAIRDWFADALAGDDRIGGSEGGIAHSALSILTLPFRLLFAFAVFMVQAWSTSRKGRAFILGLPAVMTVVGCSGLLWVTTFFYNRFTLGRAAAQYGYYSSKEDPVPGDVLMFAKKWQRLKPEEESIKYRVGVATYADGQQQTAVSLMESMAPEDQPGFIPAHLWLAKHYQRKQIETKSESFDDLSSRHLELVVQKDPSNLDAQTSLASQYQIRSREAAKVGDQNKVKENLEKAEAALENVINPMFNPNPAERVMTVAQVLQIPRLLRIKRKLGTEAGALDKFDKLFDEVLKLSRNFPDDIRLRLFIALRDSAVSVKDYGRAVDTLQKAFQTFDDSKRKQAFIRSSARVMLLEADQYKDYTSREEFMKHMRAISQSMNANSRERETYHRLIDVIAKTINNDQHLQWLKESLLETPNLSLTHLLIGFSMVMEGDIQDGKSHWKIAFRLQDGAQSVLNNIIDVASSDKESRIENILDVNLIALEMFDQPILYQSLGINYMRVGNYEQAIQNLELALKQRSGLLPSHFHLKKCYRQQGDLAKAEFHEKKLEEYLARIAPAQSEAIRKGLVDL